MKVLVSCVIYPGVKEFLEDFFNSLNNQDQLSFDLLVIEDGIKFHYHHFVRRVIVKKNKGNKSPAELRFIGISFAIENKYDIIIFADSDDYFSSNRISDSVKHLKSNDFVVNKITVVSSNGAQLDEQNFQSVSDSIDPEKLLKCNYFGLSNTAAKVRSFPNSLYIPRNIIAVDWWIYTIMLINKKKYCYTDKSTTFYRQYSDNQAGCSNILTKKKLDLGIKVKISHYENLKEYCYRLNNEHILQYVIGLVQEFSELKNKLQDQRFCERYLSVINKNIQTIKSGWWNEILSLSEWRKYE